jgi:ABC-type sugar transport system substrate-binding protein
MWRRFARFPACVSLSLIIVVCGCDQPPSGPVTTVAFDQAIGPSGAAKATQIVFILPAERTDELAVWEQVGRMEAGLARAIFEARRPQPGDPPARQAELVREAAQRGASALIVVAENPEAIAPALAEVRDQGVPIVLLDRPVAVPGQPLTLVTRPPVDAPARALVAAAVEAAKAEGFPPDGPALILSSSRSDENVQARVSAFKSALADAGVTLVDSARYGMGVANPLAAESRETILKSLTERPGIAIILSADELGIRGATLAREVLGPGAKFVLAGFTANAKILDLVAKRETAALVDLNQVGIARQAVQTALKKVSGETVPERVEVAFETHRASGPRQSAARPYAVETKAPTP